MKINPPKVPKLTPELHETISSYLKHSSDISKGQKTSLQMYLFMLAYADIAKQPVNVFGLIDLFNALEIKLPPELAALDRV